MELGVPGNFPIGCNIALLDWVKSTKKEDYDQFGCLIPYNTFADYFNGQLKHAIETLRKKYPQANIMYFDYYNNAKRLFQAPEQYGMCCVFIIFLLLNKSEISCDCCFYYDLLLLNSLISIFFVKFM